MITIPQKIRMVLAYKGISESELARRLKTSVSALNQRLKTGKFSSEELEKIAAALGGTFSFSFVLDDGTSI